MGCGSSKRVGSAADGHGSAADTGTGEACQVIDGRAIAQKRLATIKAAIEAVGTAAPRPPKLVVVLVGNNAASLSYIKQKEKAAVACGIAVELRTLEATVPQSDVEELVRQLNVDDGVDGVIVQLPLPDHMDGGAMTQLVAHRKDVDGFTGQSIGSVALDGQDIQFCPCTPLGCLELIKSTGITLQGKEAVVIGASNIVGRPMSLLLLREGCTVTTCHIHTKDTAAHARRADVLVSAVGKAGLVQESWVKPGAIVIDVGINFVPDATRKSGRRMVGDCSPGVRKAAAHVTPVPGGVGPMTVCMLMQNTLEAWQRAFSAPTAAAPDTQRPARVESVVRLETLSRDARMGVRAQQS